MNESKRIFWATFLKGNIFDSDNFTFCNDKNNFIQLEKTNIYKIYLLRVFFFFFTYLFIQEVLMNFSAHFKSVRSFEFDFWREEYREGRKRGKEEKEKEGKERGRERE